MVTTGEGGTVAMRSSVCILLALAVLASFLCSVGATFKGVAIEDSWRIAALDLALVQGFAQADVVAYLSKAGTDGNRFTTRTLRRWIKRFREEGSVDQFPRFGRHTIFTDEQLETIDAWIEDTVDFYLDELILFISTHIGLVITEGGAFYLVRRLGYFHKKLHKIAFNRSEALRAVFSANWTSSGYDASQLVFTDESGCNTRDWQRAFGRAIKVVHRFPPPTPPHPHHSLPTNWFQQTLACPHMLNYSPLMTRDDTLLVRGGTWTDPKFISRLLAQGHARAQVHAVDQRDTIQHCMRDRGRGAVRSRVVSVIQQLKHDDALAEAQTPQELRARRADEPFPRRTQRSCA